MKYQVRNKNKIGYSTILLMPRAITITGQTGTFSNTFIVIKINYKRNQQYHCKSGKKKENGMIKTSNTY